MELNLRLPRRRCTPRKATCHDKPTGIRGRYLALLDVYMPNREPPIGIRKRVLDALEMMMGRTYRVSVLLCFGLLLALNQLGYIGPPELGGLSPYQYVFASRMPAAPEILNSTLGVSPGCVCEPAVLPIAHIRTEY